MTEPATDYDQIHQVALALHTAGDTDRLRNLINSHFTRLFTAQRVFLFRYDDEWNELIWQPDDTGPEIRFPVGQGIAGWVAAAREAWSGSADGASPFLAAVDAPDKSPTRSVLSLPLCPPTGELLGVLQLTSSEVQAFSEDDADAAQVLADHAALALARAEQAGGDRQFARTLAQSVARTVDSRHLLTIGHSERVAAFAMRLGRAAGADPRQMEMLEMGALLHALGSMALQSDGVSKDNLLAHGTDQLFTDAILRGVQVPGRLRGLREAALAPHRRLAGVDEQTSEPRDALVEQILTIANAFDEIQTGWRDGDFKRRNNDEACAALRALPPDVADGALVELFIKRRCYEIERRRFSRVALRTPVDVTLLRADGRDGPSLETEAVDLSEGGLMYKAVNPPPLMSLARLLIHLPTEKVEAFGRVVRVLSAGAGEQGVRVGVYFLWFDTVR